MMRSWQRDIAVEDANLRLAYYEKLVHVAGLASHVARYHAENESVETIKIYLGVK